MRLRIRIEGWRDNLVNVCHCQQGCLSLHPQQGRKNLAGSSCTTHGPRAWEEKAGIPVACSPDRLSKPVSSVWLEILSQKTRCNWGRWPGVKLWYTLPASHTHTGSQTSLQCSLWLSFRYLIRPERAHGLIERPREQVKRVPFSPFLELHYFLTGPIEEESQREKKKNCNEHLLLETVGV